MSTFNSLKFFNGFTAEEIGLITKLMIPVTYAEGEVILKEGEISHILMLILKGQAKVAKSIDDNNLKILSLLQPGDIFGEMSFFDELPHNASVIAHKDLSVYALGKKEFDSFVEKHPRSAIKFLIRVIHTSSERIRNLNDEVKQLGAWCISLRKK